MIVGLSNLSCAKCQCKLILNESFTGKVLNGPQNKFLLLFLFTPSVALNSNFAPAVQQATSQHPAALPHVV